MLHGQESDARVCKTLDSGCDTHMQLHFMQPSKERIQELIAKWGPTLAQINEEVKLSVDERIERDRIRLKTAYIIESQESYVIEETP